MVNAWSLLYEELYGNMDETYPIKKEGKMSDKNKNDVVTFQVSTGSTSDSFWVDDGISITGNPNASPDTINFTGIGTGIGAADTVTVGSGLLGGMGEDHISFDSGPNYIPLDFGDDPYPTLGAMDDVYAYHYPGTEQDKPKPNLKDGSNQKYQEDKGIADLKSYVASTYQGHYTNKNSDVQTLDLIHSVGDAESFCRSNAIKYLRRYDKKGSAKNDILKAMHYCLLLYYFSGNTQEPDYTNTRYETF